MEASKMTRRQKVAYLENYASGKKPEKEIDYSCFTDDELRWIASMQDRLPDDKSFDEKNFTAEELAELERLNNKIIWKEAEL